MIVKTYIVRKYFCFDAVLFNFLFIKESKKKVSQVPKNIKQLNSFNTDKNAAY